MYFKLSLHEEVLPLLTSSILSITLHCLTLQITISFIHYGCFICLLFKNLPFLTIFYYLLLLSELFFFGYILLFYYYYYYSFYVIILLDILISFIILLYTIIYSTHANVEF